MFRGKDGEEINELKREGLGKRAISRLTGYSLGTISKYLLAPTGRLVYEPKPGAVSFCASIWRKFDEAGNC